eukprot:7307664-Pyramimonas_sp.AAC.1
MNSRWSKSHSMVTSSREDRQRGEDSFSPARPSWLLLRNSVRQSPHMHPCHMWSEEGDPGKGGQQGTRPRAGQLGGPAVVKVGRYVGLKQLV